MCLTFFDCEVMMVAPIAHACVLPYWFLLVVSCLPFAAPACNFDESGVCSDPTGGGCIVVTDSSDTFCGSPPDKNGCVSLVSASRRFCLPTKDAVANVFCAPLVDEGCEGLSLKPIGSCQTRFFVLETTISKTCVAAPGESFSCEDNLSAIGEFLGCIQPGSGGIPPELFFPGGTLPPDFFPTNPVETNTPSTIPSSSPSAQPDSRKRPRKVIQAILEILTFVFNAAKQAMYNDSV